MIWRIGDILDFHDQIEWIKAHAFQELSFWTLPGEPGVWQGFDPAQATQGDIATLKDTLFGISEVDLHFGFPLNSINEDTRRATIQRLIPTFRLAEDIGASTITIHPDRATAEFSGAVREAGMTHSLIQLNELAKQFDVPACIETVGTEADRDMLLIEKLDLPHVGITVDTGHIHFRDGEAFRPYGSPGELIERFHKKIVHLHVHDCDGHLDHIAIGKGCIDFPDIIRALCNVQFQGSLCLEINPDREPPEAISRSRDRLQTLIEGPQIQ